MKNIKMVLAALAIFSGLGVSYAQSPVYQGVGPVVAGSVNTDNLPDKAKNYIGRYFPAENVRLVEKEFIGGEYEVTMSNGVELTFNRKGDVREIEAPDNMVLSDDVIRSVLPEKAYRFLEANGYAANVENISKLRKGYEVDINNVQDTEIQFDSHGEVVAVGND